MIDLIKEVLATAYPESPPVVHETHISWVVLVGDRAFKVKKPVQNPFLDYRTLAARQDSCWTELRLNRRFAPDLYLEVVAFVNEPGSDPPRLTVQSLGSCDANRVPLSEHVVEVAVCMRRFSEDAILSRQLAADAVSLDDVKQFAVHLAEFHCEAEVVDRTTDFGTPRVVSQDQTDNVEFLQTCELLDKVDQQRLRQIAVWLDRVETEITPSINQRRELGFVRACHGDLHLENIVRWAGELIPFDGIEFNEHLRWIDTQADVAFTAMDLRAHGYREYAYVFNNAYLDATGDYGGIAVVRYYQVYRAMVRAKVAALRAMQLDRNSQASIDAVSDMQDHLQLAEEITRGGRKSIAITYGLSGSGKSYGSERLVGAEGRLRIRSDVERKRLFDADRFPLMSPLPLTASKIGAGLYSREATDATYERLLQIAGLAVRAETPVIIDATFLKREQREPFAKLANALSAEFQIIRFEADLEVLRERVTRRQRLGNDASDADLSVLDRQIKDRDPLSADERKYVVDFDMQ